MNERAPNSNSGVFIRSGQVWKAVAGLIVMLIGTGLVYWSVSAHRLPEMKLEVLVVGTLLAAAGTIIPWLIVRCPSCHDRWLWRAMSRHPHRQWLAWLLAQEMCPKCGYDHR